MKAAPQHAVLFDLDDTLIDRRAAFRRYAADLLARRGVDAAEALDVLVELDRRGRVSREDFERAVCTHYPELAGCAADFAERFAAFVEPRRGVREALTAMVAQRKVAIVSNGSSARQRAKLESAELNDLEIDVLISEEVGYAKPDPRIFARALRERAPETVWFVGDHPDHDIAGASRLGMQTCWVRRGQPWNALVHATAVVDEIEDAFEVLRP